MDAPIADIAVGGGGRYLILHQPKRGTLAVFDVNEAKVVKLLPAGEDNVKFTAGLDKLVVALPGSRTLQRLSLKSFVQELSVSYPDKMEVTALSMGCASQGPVVVVGKDVVFPPPKLFLFTLDNPAFPGDNQIFASHEPPAPEGPHDSLPAPRWHCRRSR